MLNIYVDTMNPLLESCAYKKIDEVKAAIQSGANINQTDMYGCTPLLFVCNNGCLPIIKLLLANKANVIITNIYGNTALTIAARMGYKDIKNILRNHVYSILVETGLTVLPRDILREI